MPTEFLGADSSVPPMIVGTKASGRLVLYHLHPGSPHARELRLTDGELVDAVALTESSEAMVCPDCGGSVLRAAGD